MSTHVLGVNCAFHESSVALVSERGIIAAIEEERVNRIKHAKRPLVSNSGELPEGALNYCLRIAGLTLSQIDCIAFSFNPEKRFKNNIHLNEKVVAGSWGTESGEKLFYDNLMSIPEQFRQKQFEGKFIFVDHAMSHAASAFYPSSFHESAIISIDGIGETESTLLAFGRRSTIDVLEQIRYPNSLGFLWEKIAMYFGMTEYDACKVMSLASFGDADRYYRHFRSFVEVCPGGFWLDADFCRFRVDDFSTFERLFDTPVLAAGQSITPVYMDIAAALQKITSEILVNLAHHVHALTSSKNLCVAGGVALNCVANTAMFENGPFENIFIQPAANDGGTSLGAALHVYNRVLRGDSGGAFHMQDAYLGPEFSNEEIAQSLRKFGVVYKRPENLVEYVAGLISEGFIVGWFQGRMEFGPRALGNRSLLADPRDPEMTERMNRLVKHREDHRPFCPSVLEEDAGDWFVMKKNAISSQYMLMAYPAIADKRSTIPAVVHVDGTSRIQVVRQKSNPKFHALLSQFKKKTGVPMLLNTSFNDREPIVCTPEDAIKTFLRTEIDCLAIGDFLLKKQDQLGLRM